MSFLSGLFALCGFSAVVFVGFWRLRSQSGLIGFFFIVDLNA